ncbi:MAG: histone deacetylase [Candidatus Zixiibacteriota bacterium]
MAASPTGWVSDGEFVHHNASIDHPERPERLVSITAHLTHTGLLERLVEWPAIPAADEDLMRVHTRAYLTMIERSEGRWLDPDTYVGRNSPAIARLAAGAVQSAALGVWRGELTNAFCAVRPPGHHALPDRAMGFCLYNNIAIAAKSVLHADPDARVFIVDWDVHHGNGTQAIFYEDASVLYASVHQYPFYPGTGALHETGRGKGAGTTVNRPLPAGSGDKEFLGAITDIIDNHARPFCPDLVMISAGFDAHESDPLAGLNVTTHGFGVATRLVCEFAAEVCAGRVLSVLEGGYNVHALAECAEVHLEELLAAAMARHGNRAHAN